MLSSFPLKNRLILFLLMLASTIFLGSLGYALIKIYVEHENTTMTNAIYFSVATISTLGHYPTGVDLHSDIGKWFTITYIIIGLGIIFGGIQALVGPWIEMKVKRAVRDKHPPVPKDAHVVICGYTDISKLIAEELKILNVPFVIVDETVPQNLPAVLNKPTRVEALREANISRATALIAAMDSERNAVTVLTAKKLNGEMKIIAVADEKELAEMMKKCGADVVISKDELLSRTLTHWIQSDFTHQIAGTLLSGMDIKEIPVQHEFIGQSIKESHYRERIGTIIAIHRDGDIIVNPSPDLVLKENDVLIVLGGGEAS